MVRPNSLLLMSTAWNKVEAASDELRMRGGVACGKYRCLDDLWKL
jgi:hypothetical protein